jgi:hypothetical protein
VLLLNGDAGQKLCSSVIAKWRCTTGTLRHLLQMEMPNKNSVVVLLKNVDVRQEHCDCCKMEMPARNSVAVLLQNEDVSQEHCKCCCNMEIPAGTR